MGPDGHVFVADAGNSRVQVFSAAGTFVRSWGGYGDGPGQVQSLAGLAVGSDGSVLVTDSGLRRVTRFTAQGGFLAHWGDTGPGALTQPIGIDVAPGGNVYVADAGDSVVKVFAPDGKFLGTVGEPGSGDGQLTLPVGVAVAADGAVLVSDASGYDIQTFRPLLAATEAPHVSRAKGFGHPTGKVRVLDRGQRIKTVKLRAKHAGKVTVRLGRLDAGKHRIKAVFRGSDQIAKTTSKAKTLRVRR